MEVAEAAVAAEAGPPGAAAVSAIWALPGVRAAPLGLLRALGAGAGAGGMGPGPGQALAAPSGGDNVSQHEN